jgi:hypothetical protein
MQLFFETTIRGGRGFPDFRSLSYARADAGRFPGLLAGFENRSGRFLLFRQFINPRETFRQVEKPDNKAAQ